MYEELTCKQEPPVWNENRSDDEEVNMCKGNITTSDFGPVWLLHA